MSKYNGCRPKPMVTNNSGIVGLKLKTVTHKSGNKTEVVASTWYKDGKCHSTEYSILLHGGLLATAKAMAKRETEIGFIYDLTPKQAWKLLEAS